MVEQHFMIVQIKEWFEGNKNVTVPCFKIENGYFSDAELAVKRKNEYEHSELFIVMPYYE